MTQTATQTRKGAPPRKAARDGKVGDGKVRVTGTAPKAAAPAGPKGKAAPKTSAASMEALWDTAEATSYARDATSRARRRTLDKVTLVLCGLLGISVSANVWMGLQPTEYRYFAADSLGRIVPVTPLDEPVQSTAEVLDWFRIAVVESLTMSFTDYKVRLQSNKRFFTDAGWDSFKQAIERASLVETVQDRKLVTSVVPTGAPVILESNVLRNGRFGWRVEMPVLVSYESASTRETQKFTIVAVIVRRPEVESPRGLGISQIVAR